VTGHRSRAALLLLAALLLGGCASREARDDGAWLSDREALFSEHPNWSVSGRLALSDGDRGGSLSMRWQAREGHHLITLSTLVGGRQWRLEFDERSATLEGSDVGRLTGPNPDPLVEAAVGWPIPVRDLSWWVRGLVPPERSRRIRYAEDGTLAYAEAPPWSLAFERYSDFASTVLPSRLEANSGRYRVRMVLRNWQLGVQP
jgi:outer membrane lipoprotein LolB